MAGKVQMDRLIVYQKQFIQKMMTPEISHTPDRFAIYHNNWCFGLIKALKNHYPVCERLTGIKFFEAMTKQYVKLNPSSYFSLNDYGENFAEFVGSFPPANQLPYLPDVATLEWAIHRALIGKANINTEHHKIIEMMNDLDKINNLDNFGNLITPQLSLNINLNIMENGTFIASKYPIHKIWQTNQEDYIGDTTVNLNEGEAWLFVWLKGFDLRIDTLEKIEWEILKVLYGKKMLKGKISLIEMLQSESGSAGSESTEYASSFIQTLSNLIQKGLIIAIPELH